MSPSNDILDQPVMALSKTDMLYWRDFFEGTLITGAPGAGKSSTSGKRAAFGLLRAGLQNGTPSGALILTAKAEETTNWTEYAKACGREKDLIIFNAESGLCFDPLHYEWTRKGRGAGDLESIIDFFSTLLSIGKKDQGHGHDPFWERGAEQIMRNSIKLLDLAGAPVSIVNIDRVIKSLPSQPGQEEEESWKSSSYCYELVASIEARFPTLTPDQKSDLEFVVQYLFRRWPAFDERPRSSLEMTWAGMADKFLFSPFNRIFCSGKCDFTPEDTTHRGKIVIVDFPLLEYGHETGKLIQILIKLIFQRAWLRRKLADSPNPVFLFQDEFQYFCVPRFDNFFQQTCRGSQVAVICLTQNILNLAETLGEPAPGSKTKSFLGNLGLKIFHQQNDIETCNYAADQIGKAYRDLSGWSGHENHAGVSGTEHLAHIVEPITFSRLKKPDSKHPVAGAIVYQSGTTFNASITAEHPQGANYLHVGFSRDI